jgi:hypothetical protein
MTHPQRRSTGVGGWPAREEHERDARRGVEPPRLGTSFPIERQLFAQEWRVQFATTRFADRHLSADVRHGVDRLRLPRAPPWHFAVPGNTTEQLSRWLQHPASSGGLQTTHSRTLPTCERSSNRSACLVVRVLPLRLFVSPSPRLPVSLALTGDVGFDGGGELGQSRKREAATVSTT